MIEYPTQQRIKELFDYREDGQLIRITKSNNRINVGDIAGAISNGGYRRISVDNKLYVAHRLIWIYLNGFNPEHGLDHIDRDKLNNRIDNLREITMSCNLRNTGNPCTNTSGVKGVTWDKEREKWSSQICVMRKQKYIGRHEDFNEAVLHRLAGEQCLEWEGCDSSSPAYQYAIKHRLIKRQ